MGRRTAARVAPTAEPTASTCSNNSAVIFTPVVPDDHAVDNRESGDASSARCREDGQAYVAHPRAGRRAPSFQSEKWDAVFSVQHGRGSRGQFFTWNRAAGSGTTEGACGGESRRIARYLMPHAL
jgi:hypothetical protein